MGDFMDMMDEGERGDGPCPNPEPCPLHPRHTDVVLGSSIVIRQDFRDADPDRIALSMVRDLEAMQESSARTIGYVDRGMDTGQLRRSFAPRMSPPMGTAQDMVDACNDVRPAGVRLVGIVVQGRVLPWRWRWVEPVALWLLRRAGYEVCQ